MSFGWEMMTANFDDGFNEACCRALSKSFITKDKYEELVQAGSLDEFKVLLEDTDYGKYVVTMTEENDINELKRKLQEKLRDEIEYLMANATHPLSEFLEMMLHSYQISNVISLMASKRDNRQNANQAKATLHPLGMFQGFSTVQKLAAEEELVTLFQEILIDLPVGEYFRKFLDQIIMSTQEGEGGNAEGVDMQQIAEKIGALSSADQLLRIQKIWLAEFHRWIMAHCNDATCEHMDNLLKAEADWETLNVNYMGLSRNKDGNAGAADKDYVKNLQHNLGHLYPGFSDTLAMSKDYTDFVNNLACSPYHEYFTKIPDPAQALEMNEQEIHTIDDFKKRDLSKKYSLAFFGQFHYGVYYAYLKLKQIEIENIVHLAQIISLKVIQKNHPAYKKFVPPFQWNADEQDQQL